MKYFIFTLTGISFLFFYRCQPKECDEIGSVDYNFKLPISITPFQDRYNIGDTLSVTSIFSNPIEDLNSKQTLVLENYSFFPFMRLKIIDTLPILEGFDNVKVLEVKSENHTFSQTSYGTPLNFEYGFIENTYSFSIDFILEKAGIYYVSFGSSLPLEADVYDFPGKCKHRTPDVYFFMNENNEEENNYDLFLLNKENDEFLTTHTKEMYKKLGGYCFEVN